jgi:hypothetical protein
MKAIAAQDAGKFKDEIVPIEVKTVTSSGEETIRFDVDEGPRRGTTLEAMAKLKPAFKQEGSVTAGNSSQMSDGAAAVMVMERERAASLGLKPLVRFLGYAVAGVRPEVMGIGPMEAIPKALKLTGLSLSDMDVIELNEAFATQSLAVLRELDLNGSKVNVNGGAIAHGHPLGCTGAKLTVQIIHEMLREGHRYGMVTMCIGGGMGGAGQDAQGPAAHLARRAFVFCAAAIPAPSYRRNPGKLTRKGAEDSNKRPRGHVGRKGIPTWRTSPASRASARHPRPPHPRHEPAPPCRRGEHRARYPSSSIPG